LIHLPNGSFPKTIGKGDGDLVQLYSKFGECLLPAVTPNKANAADCQSGVLLEWVLPVWLSRIGGDAVGEVNSRWPSVWRRVESQGKVCASSR
jgi:hypothetical protein